MIPLNSNANVDNSDLVNYPDGRVRDNDGTNNGTGVNRSVYGDIHSTISKLMRLYAITPNSLPDNETNGYQIIDAFRGLASKNDFIYSLSTNGTILNVDIKFSQMLDNEFIVCLAAFNKSTETQIKGIGAGSFTIAYSGNFKTNEYVRVIKTSGGVSIVRLADALSLDAMVADYYYLKKASQAEENVGTIDTKATTPLTNLVAFTKRVIGTDSVNFLAQPTGVGARNGLLSSADKAIIDNVANVLKSKVVKLNSWSLDSQFTVFTGFTGSEVIMGMSCFLECTVANNGFSIGDVITAPTPYPADSGRTAAQGIGFQFKESVNNLFRVLVNDQVCVMQAWTVDGAIANPIFISNTSQWAIRFVILYS